MLSRIGQLHWLSCNMEATQRHGQHNMTRSAADSIALLCCLSLCTLICSPSCVSAGHTWRSMKGLLVSGVSLLLRKAGKLPVSRLPAKLK